MSLRRTLFSRSLSSKPFQPPIVVLGLIMMLGPFAIDLYLPVIPLIASDFQVDAQYVSFALSIYMLGFALGHLIWGGLSDSVGRLRILFPGLASYVLLNILAAMSQHISHLMVIRGFQGLAAAAVVTVIPALVYDCFEAKKCAKVLSLILFQLMALVPFVAIVISGVVVPWLGWRSVFGLLACFGVAILLLVRYQFVETLAPAERLSLTFDEVVKRYRYVLSRFSAVGYLIVQSLFLAGMLSFLVMSPVIYAYEYNIAVEYYGVLYAISVSFGAICCFINSRLIHYFSLKVLISTGLACGVLTSGILLILFFTGNLSLVAVVVCTAFYCGSFALVGPNANTMAFSKLPFSTGTVNSVGGVLRFSIGGTLSGLCAGLASNPVVALVWTLFFCSLGASVMLSFLIWLQYKKNYPSILVLPDATANDAANDRDEVLSEAAA